ncbi:MAG: hypothetical protein ACFHWZ_15485 [Phycisphaerales bacterium]
METEKYEAGKHERSAAEPRPDLGSQGAQDPREKADTGNVLADAEMHQPGGHQAAAAWVFGLLTLSFLIVAFFTARADTVANPVVALLGAVMAGCTGFFLTGSLTLVAQGSLGPFGKVAVKATAAVALFLIVFFGWPQGDGVPVPRSLNEFQGKQLSMVLEDLEGVVSQHRWQEFRKYVDPENLAAQQELGTPYDQYIEDALGFNTTQNQLPAVAAGEEFRRLEQIVKMDVVSTEVNRMGEVIVLATVQLANGEHRQAKFTMEWTGETYRFSLGLG